MVAIKLQIKSYNPVKVFPLSDIHFMSLRKDEIRYNCIYPQWNSCAEMQNKVGRMQITIRWKSNFKLFNQSSSVKSRLITSGFKLCRSTLKLATFHLWVMSWLRRHYLMLWFCPRYCTSISFTSFCTDKVNLYILSAPWQNRTMWLHQSFAFAW